MSLVLDGTNGMTAPQGAVYNGIASGTAVASTSGTSITFTNIPSWAKRITVMFNGVQTSGTSQMLIRIGSGSISTTGYNSNGVFVINAGGNVGTSSTAGIIVSYGTSSSISTGNIVLTNISGNIWTSSGVLSWPGQNTSSFSGVSPSLSGALDRVVITPINGTDTFTAGSINILYE